LVNVLADGSSHYLYGRGRIGELTEDTWRYHLADSQESVRQFLDNTNTIHEARAYEPYGSIMRQHGHEYSAFGYTGQWKDETKLYQLRARYYEPTIGRFTQRDPLGLHTDNNLYQYAGSNPVNWSDPSGYLPGWTDYIQGLTGPELFGICLAIHTIARAEVQLNAGFVVDICRLSFRQDLWFAFDLSGDLPSSAHNLFGWFLFESYGPGNDNWLEFDANEPLTQELATSTLVNDVRTWYYEGGDRGGHTDPRYVGGDTYGAILYKFGTAEYIGTLLFDSIRSASKFSLPLEFVMGSFTFQVKRIEGSRLGFRVDNDMTIESGTHIRDRFRPEYLGSVEDLIQLPGYDYLSDRPLSEVINKTFLGKPVISILSSRTAEQTMGLFGGGNLFQTFSWTESYDPCLAGLLPWEVMLRPLHIGVWANYKSVTEHPGAPFP
jgi:RHS repeat-associated protein